MLAATRRSATTRSSSPRTLYEKAHDHLSWLRGQIIAARRAAHPDIELVDELKRMADLELIGALGAGRVRRARAGPARPHRRAGRAVGA